MNGHPIGEIEAYLDGNLPSMKMREVGEHLTKCAACRSELARAKRLRERLTATLSALAPARAPDFTTVPLRRGLWSRPSVRLAVALAGVLLAVVVYQRASPGLLQAGPATVVAKVPDVGGREVTVYSNGNVFVGGTKLRAELAAPVREAFTAGPRPQPVPHSVSSVRILQPKLTDIAVVDPPRELAWTGPTSSSYVVAVERLAGGQWQAVTGFPRAVNGFSVDLPALQPGDQYRWRVNVRSGPSSGWAFVRVLSSQDLGRLAYAQRQFGEESAVYGSLCASLGLLSKAEGAFAAQVTRHPGQADLRRALDAVRQRMGRE